MRLPPLNSLRAFEVAARRGGFTGAADELHVTPAAISHQVKVLESFLGIELFRRLPKGLALTGADGVMVGRGTMGAPWLVGQIDAALSGRPVPPTPGPAAKLALAAEQLQALVAARGDHGLLIARKHLSWTCTGFPGAPQLRHQLMRAPTPAAAVELLNAAAASVETATAAG